jgi:Ca2+-binding RTX toxin-like protein
MSDGTIKYRNRNSVDPSGINGQSVYNGTAGVDRISGGNDSDTFWGGKGADVIEGGDGADVALGGDGNDIITDLNGDDVPKGGPGNDAIDAGPGLDIIMGGEGKDFTNGGANANETFGGEGDDFIILGQSLDAAFGDSGDDFEEGGDQPDLMQGDSGNLFFQDDSQTPGSDILIGQGGDDDYDMEGGDDIGVGGPGIEKVAGASGYDWEIGLGDPQPQDMDLSVPLIPLDILQVGVRDKFNEVEALSGGDLNDTLRGDDVVPSAAGGGGFIGCNVLDAAGVARIRNLNTLVTTLPTPLQSIVDASAAKDCPILSGPVWGEGNILLGGGGSDLIEGRGANDIIDGDKYLNLRLSVRNAAGVEIGSASVNQQGQSAMTSQYLRDASGALTGPTLQEAVFAGTVDPGNIVAVREILTGSGGTDTAVFSDVRAAYQCSINGGALGPCALTSNGAVTTVVHSAGTGVDGTDTIRNIERLQFSDSVPPVAPLIGTAVRGNASVTVNWTEPAGAVTGSEVEVTTAAGVQVGALRPVAAGVTSLVITGLTNGTAYRFRVRSSNESGTGPFSAFSNTVTPATVPGAPTIGTATAGNASATVNWTRPANNGGSAITGFNVQVVNPAGAQVGALRPAAAGATSLLVTGLNNGTNYRFRVQAVNDVGSSVASALSNTVTPAAPPPTGVVPGAPAIRNAVSGVAGGAVTATANWRPTTAGSSPITSYRVTATPVGAGTAVTQTQAAAPGLDQSRVMTLQPGQYRFTVVAVNATGAGPASAASNAVIAR